MTQLWEKVSRQIEADALGDLRGHKRLQSPEGQEFLDSLEHGGYHTERTAPLMPWLAREFRKGRLKTDPPHLFYDTGRYDEHLSPEKLNHWADWYHSTNRRKVPLDQVQIGDMPDEIEAWERDEAKRLKEADLEPHKAEGDIKHQFPDGWTIRHLPGSALPYEAWNMRGKPTEEDPDGLPICVGDPGYQEAADEGKTMIYSLRDPQHRPHVTWEMRPTQHGEKPPFAPGADYQKDWEGRAAPDWAVNPDAIPHDLDTYHAMMEGNAVPGSDFVPGQPTVNDRSQIREQYRRYRFHHDTSLGPPLPEKATVEQIQGKGNSIPKPEYQARLKDYFSTFPSEERPQWQNNDPAKTHEDLMEPDEDEGGYRPHGDYGLPIPPPDYEAILNDLHQGRWNEDSYDPADGRDVYQHALKHGHIPQLASALDSYRDNVVWPGRNDLEDANHDFLDYPGEDWEEDPERWHDQAAEWNYDTPKEAFDSARRQYEENQKELYAEHAPSQVDDDMVGQLSRHWDSRSGTYTNEPQWLTRQEQEQRAAEQPQQVDPEPPVPEWQPQVFAKTAAFDLRSLPLHPWLGNELDNPRFLFNHLKSENDWGGLQRHDFEVAPANAPASHQFTNEWGKTKRYGYDPELVDPDDTSSRFGTEFRWKGHPDWRQEFWRNLDDGTEGGFREDVPTDPNMLYRGLSHEEWENAKRTGQFQSNGEYNIGGEAPGSTLFSSNLDQARSYATGFAPWQRKPGFQTPSYVIATPRTPDAYSHPGMSADTTEIIKPSPTPFSAVTQAWQFKPQYIQHGDMLVRSEDHGKSYFGRPSINGGSNVYRPVDLGTQPVMSHHVSAGKPLYKRWVFSPATGNVTLSDNSGDPLDVKYHTDLAGDVNEPNLIHGYAYRIGGGWRLTDWDAKPVSEPYVIASVMRALKGAEAPSAPHSSSWDPAYQEDWDRLHAGLPS